MPWRGPREEGEFPTLGYDVGEWIEAFCVIPDGELLGRPYVLTDEMWRWLIHFYRLHPSAVVEPGRPSAPFYYRGGQLMRAQKWAKSPFAGANGHSQAFAPVLFDGWDANGEPVGRPHPSPWIQVVATSEEQTDNVWLAMYEMATRGPIADFPGVDIGHMDINLPGGGKIEPRSSSGKSRLGARITFAVFDESHLMTEGNGGVLLASTMKRNLGGMGGRWMEATNAFDPTERSVAQRTQESGAKDVLIDYRPAQHRPNLDDDDDALQQLAHVYGDSWWVDRRRILADARDPGVCQTPADAMRYFFNLIEVGVSVAVDPTRWDALARSGSLRPGEVVALGFKGSQAGDCTSVVASRISDGRWLHLRTWDPAEEPEGRIPREQVDRFMTDAFTAYDVRYLYAVPAGWQEYLDLWEGRWPKRVVEMPTNVDRRMDDLVTRFIVAFRGDFTHDGHPTLAAHAKAAALVRGSRRQPRPEEDSSIVHNHLRLAKLRPSAHIDAFLAGLLATAGRGRAIEDGALQPAGQTFVSWR